MKKIILSSLVVGGLIFGYGCKKKDNNTTDPDPTPTVTPLVVKEENKAVFFDFSETWCHYCGTNAVPAFDKIVADLENSTLVPISVSGTSTPASFNSKYSADLAKDYAVKGYPSFFVNKYALSPTGGVYSSVDANMNWVTGKANIFSGSAVNAGVALDKTVDGTNLIVRTKCKFYTDFTAGTDYRLAIYVLEDNVLADQSTDAGVVSNMSHRNLLRGGASSTYKGDAINNKGAIASGQEFEKEFSIAIDPSWNKANLKVVAVIWDATNSGLPTCVNANMVK